MRFLILIALVLICPAYAQADDATLDQRITLAKKMHKIRTTRDQVNASIDQAAKRLPKEKRAAFIASIQKSLNYKAVEKVSIEAMVETFTAPELAAMVEYYSKPEARSAREKEAEYGRKVTPEIIRMLDAAMMRSMTGGN